MDADRWARIQSLFHAALERPAAERHAFLDQACREDPGLADEVGALLEEDARPDSILDRGLAPVAEAVLGPGAGRPYERQRFGAYRIVRVLGEGGMGVVYLARRDDLGTLAAIKILRDAWLSPERRERFHAEQRTLAQLNHPGIARLYDANLLPDGTPWFVMEYVEGESLTEYCRTRAPTVRERLRLFRSVCEAVQHAHQHAVIHRDLKPSNILVSAAGAVKLLDFGIAKQLESVDRPVDQTRTGLRLLTPAYAAPEQILAGRLGAHTDVYALGVVLYQLLTDRLPFDLVHRTPSEAAAAIVEQQPVRPSSLNRAIAARTGTSAAPVASRAEWTDLDVLCLTAMHKDPARRYASVEALIRDLDHFLAREPLEARPDSVGYRMDRFLRRNWRPVGAAVLALATLIALVVFYTVRLQRARNEAVAEAARTHRVKDFMLDLFEGGDETVGPAESLRVVTLVDRGLHKARALDGEPRIQADLYQTLGGIYQKLGNLDRADSLLQLSLARRRALYGPDNPEVARALIALGLLRNDQARFEDAERLVRQGLAMTRRHLPADHADVARATAALGVTLENRGRYAEAIPLLEQAAAVQAAAPVSADLSSTLTELANCRFYRGDYEASDSLNRRVLAIDRELYGPSHPNVAIDLINIGAVQYEWGHYHDAEGYYRQALDIIQRFYGRDHPETASALTMLGRALVAEDHYDEAAGLLRQALAIQERVYGKVHPRVASALNDLGRVAEQQGHLDQAEADFRRMAAIYRSVYGGRHYYIGVALSNLGGVYQDRGEYARAAQTFRHALAIYALSLPPGHQLVGIARIRLGRSLAHQGRYREAANESQAGYDILRRKGHPPTHWLQVARADLVRDYRTLHEPVRAARFEAELADSATAAGRH